MRGWQIQEEAWRAFEAWLCAQPDEVQDMDILEQIEVYAKANGADKP